MRLPFVILWLAVAACLTGADAEPSDIVTRSDPANSHLRVQDPVQDNKEERANFENLMLLASVASRFGREKLSDTL